MSHSDFIAERMAVCKDFSYNYPAPAPGGSGLASILPSRKVGYERRATGKHPAASTLCS